MLGGIRERTTRSTRVARTFVLYEIYNRAASFAPAMAPASPSLGGFGNGPHS